MKVATVSIARRFRGPPESGNGGYVVGLLARYAPEPVEVRLHLPPPLEAPLDVVAADGDRFELRDGETLLASSTPATVEFEVPECPPEQAAAAASAGYAGFGVNPYPECFVCGPSRSPGDGLRIFAGPVAAAAGALYAAPWRPDASLAGTRDTVRPEFMAAALDCPGYFAVATGGRPMLLGSLALRIDRAVAVGEPCVIAAWSLGGAGRKWRAATVLYASDGSCVARGLATWIALK